MADSKNVAGLRSGREETLRQLARWMPAMTAILALGLIVLAWFTLVMPRISPLMAGGSHDLAPLRQLIAKETRYIEQVDQAVAAYRAVPEAYRSKVRHMVPETAEFPELMAQMEEIAHRNAVALGVVEMSAAKAKGAQAAGPETMRVTASWSGGSYRDFKNVISDIQSLERILDINQISYSPGMTSFQLVMSAYRLN